MGNMKKKGAGALVYAKDTGRYLIAHRSGFVNNPGEWATWGGTMEPGETPEDALHRELQEELGYSGFKVKRLFMDDSKDYQYYNFLATIDNEFYPQINWEHQGFRWIENLDDVPKPVHFGLKKVIEYLKKNSFITDRMIDLAGFR